MARKNATSKTSAAKTPARTPIVYERQPEWGTLVKRRVALAKAQAEAAATLNGTSKSPGKAAAEGLRRKLMDRAREIVTLERRSGEAFARSALGHGGAVQFKPTYFTTSHLGPSYVSINQGGDLPQSGLIYPCPDDGTGHYWSAWFEDNIIVLVRWGVLTIEGSNFTGKVSAFSEVFAQGIADIGPYGYVVLNTGSVIEVWTPTWCPIASTGRIEKWPFGGPNVAVTSTPGIVSLNTSRTRVDLQFANARPGDIVWIMQTLFIEAREATVQVGPSRSDCVAGGCYGWLETPEPTVQLEYNSFAESVTLPTLQPPWPTFPHRQR